MTDTNPFAALLDGVPRRVIENGGDALYHGKRTTYLPETEVLAALAAAVPADLAEAGKVLEGVTPGPWKAGRHAVGVRGASGMDRLLFETLWHDDQGKTDMRFIAWCREGVPALLARIAAQEAQIKGLIASRDNFKWAAEKAIAVAEKNTAALAAMTKERDEALHFLDVAVDKSPEPLKKLGKHLASLLDEDDWPTAERLLNGAATALAAERAKTAKLVEAVLLRVAETLAGMTYREVSQEARARIKRALDAAITEAGQ